MQRLLRNTGENRLRRIIRMSSMTGSASASSLLAVRQQMPVGLVLVCMMLVLMVILFGAGDGGLVV